MAQSWFRNWVNSKFRKASPVRRFDRRTAGRRTRLFLERLEDRTLLDAPAGAGQLFNLSSSSSNSGSLYLREDLSTQYIQFSTDNATWSNLQGLAGTGKITINQSSLQSALGAGATVPGAFVIAGSIYTNGRALDISAQGSIEVASNVVVSTRDTGSTNDSTAATAASVGNSGNLTLEVQNPEGVLVSAAAPSVTIDSGAKLLANAVNAPGGAYAPGDINVTVASSQLSINIPILANFGVDTQTSSLDVDSGATISGGNVTISATAGDKNPLNAIDQDINDQNGSLSGLLKSVLTYATDYLSLPISIQFKSPSAEVTLNSGVNVTSTSNLNITSEADADATGEATFSHDTQSGIGAAFGFNWASPSATTTIDSKASLTGDGLVNIGSTVNSTAIGTARVTQNNGPGFLKNNTAAPFAQRFKFGDAETKSLSGPFVTDPNRIQVAGVVAVDKLTSITTVQKDASITSDTDVTVQAVGNYTGQATATTASYWDGRAGIGFAVGYSTSQIQAIVDGKITVSGSNVKGNTDFINPYQAVNFANNTITFNGNPGFSTGDQVTYSSGGGGAIPGLQSGQTYYVIVPDSNNPQTIQLAATAADAQSRTYITFNPYPTLTDNTSTTPITVPITNVNDIDNTLEYAYNTGIKAGDKVTYNAVAGQAINGLVGGQTYTVTAGGDPTNPNAFQLEDSNGNLVQFDDRPTLTEANGTPIAFNVGTDPNSLDIRGQAFAPVIDTSNNAINLGYRHEFTNGEKIVYNNGGGASIGIQGGGTLTQGGTYLAVVIANQPNELGLEDTSGHRITLAAPGNAVFGSNQRFTPLVNTGDALTYHAVLGLNTPGLMDGTTYYAIVNPYHPGVIYLSSDQADAGTAGSAGQQAYNDAVSTFMQGVSANAVNDYYYKNNIDPNNPTPAQQAAANSYASGIVASDGQSILQTYLNNNPGQDALWFTTGATAARNGSGTPIVVTFTANEAIMSGVRHSFTSANTGINISATLSASDNVSTTDGLGDEPTVYEALSKGELAPALPGILKGLIGGDGFTQTNIAQNLPKQSDGSPTQPNGPNLSLNGAFAVIYTNNNVLVQIGSDAVLKTTQSITLSSSDTEYSSIYVNASITKPESGQSKTTPISIAAAVGVAIFNNSAETQIEDGAHLDASNALSVTSSVSYPFSFPTNAASAASTFGSNVMGTIAGLVDGTLGLDNFLMNSWIQTSVSAGDVGIAGNIGVNVYNNKAQTLIGNAYINQDPTYRNPTLAQTVAFDANNTIDSFDMTGDVNINLTPEAISKAIRKGGSFSDFLGGGSSAKKSSWGGALFVVVANNTTTTKVASGAQIYTAMPAANVTASAPTLSGDTLDLGYAHGFTLGEPIFYDNSGPASSDIGGLQRGHIYYAIPDANDPDKLQLAASAAAANAIVPVPIALTSAGSGSGQTFTPAALSVTAETSNIQISLGAAGGSADNFGVSGTFSVLVFTNHTTAQVDAGAQISGPTGVGDLSGTNIDAADITDLINLAGSTITGGREGFGFTATVNVLNRQTLAILGANPNDSSDALATSAVSLGGDLGVNAQNAGVLVAASFAAAVQATPEEEGDSQPAGGSKSVSWAPVIATVIPEGIGAASNGLNIAGKGSQIVGSAAGDETEGQDSGIGVSGDASLNEIVHDTADALVNEKPASAGSANITAGNVSVTANNQTIVVALAGAVAVAVGEGNEKGLAGSFTQNTLIGETKAYISGAVIQDAGALTVLATRGGYIDAVTAGVAAAVGDNSKGVAGSVSVNIITDTVAAYLLGDTVTLAGDLETHATDSSRIITVAGGVGYGGKAGVGLAIAVNVITNTVSADLDTTTVTQSGGGLDVSASNENPTSDARIVSLTGTVGVSSRGNGVAGMISVNVIHDATNAYLLDTHYTNTNSDATSNGMSVQAFDHSWIISAGFAVGVGKDTSVGAALCVNVIADPVSAYLDDTKVNTLGSLTVHAETGGTIGVGTVGVAGSGSGTGVAGSLSVNVLANSTEAYITGDSNSKYPATVTAGGPVQVTASDQALIVCVAGGVGISLDGSAVGGALSGNAIANQTYAYINDAAVHATGSGSGLTVSATETSTIVAISVGAALGDGTSGSGSITVNVIDNQTKAYIQASPVDANGNPAIETDGDIQVTATDGSTVIVVSGAVAVSTGGSAFGGSLSINLMLNHTDAYIDGSAVKSDNGGVLVSAGWAPSGSLPTSFTLGDPSDASFAVNLPSLPNQVKGSVVSVCVSGTAGNWTAIAGAVPINIIANEVKGYVTNSSVTASGDTNSSDTVSGNVQVLASDNSVIGSGALGLSVGQNAGGACLGSSDILNHVYAYIENSHIATTGSGGVDVEAAEKASTTTVAFGAAAAGQFALGGSVGINVTKNVVDAHISTNSTVQSVGTVEVQATDTPSIFAGTGGLAAGGTAAAGAALASNDIADTLRAYIDGSSVSSSAGDVRVEAASRPTVDAATVGGAASFEVAVGGSITLSVLDDSTTAYISGKSTTVTAHGNVVVSAYQDLNTGIGSGGFSGAGAAAIGLANTTIITDDITEAYIGAGTTVTGNGNGAAYQAYTGQKDGNGVPITEAFHGVSVTSVSFQEVLSLAVGGSGAGSAAIAGSATVEVLNETSKAHVDAGAQVNVANDTPNADQGVNIHATNFTRVQSGAGSAAGAGGVGVGAGIDVGVITKHTEAYIADASSTTHYFGTQAVDTVQNAINVGANNPFQNGDKVVYHDGGRTGISGLTDGSTYYVLTNSSQPNQIQLAATKGGTPIQLLSAGSSSTQSLTLPSTDFASSAVDTTNNLIKLGSSNPFTNGEAVVYDNGGGTSIGGLTQGSTYYVITNSTNPSAVQLAATAADAAAGKAIALTSQGTSSTQSLTPASVVFTPSDVTWSSLGINVGTVDSFTPGEAVVYNGKGAGISGLTDNTTYYVVTNPDNHTIIGLASSQSDALQGKAIVLTSGGTNTAQSLTPVSATFGSSAVDTTNNNITVGSNNPFTPGEAVVYHNGGGTSIGGLVDGATYYVMPVQNDNTKIQLVTTPGANAIALTSGGSSSTQSLTPAGGVTPLVFGPTDVVQGTLPDTINLGYADGFVTGQPVVYNNGGGTGIGIVNPDGTSGTLRSGGVYYVIVVDAQTIKLAASPEDAAAGRAINLTSNGTSAMQSIQAVNTGVSGPNFGPGNVITNSQANTINTALPNGFTNGQPIVYDDGGGPDIGGLQDGHLYYAIVDPSNPNLLQLATSAGGSAITLTSNGASASQGFQGGTLGTAQKVASSAVTLASAANSINLGSPTSLTTGDEVVYNDGGVRTLFGPSAVNTTLNLINVGATNPFSNGETVVYHDGGGTGISGLTDGSTYYVITNSSLPPNEIQLAATTDDATAGNAIALGSTGSSSSQSLTPTGIDIGGLTSGQTYYAIVDPNNSNLLQLADSAADATAGNAITLTSGGFLQNQAFHTVTPGTASATFNPSNVNYYSGTATDNSINLGAKNPFTTGQAVVYNDGFGTDVSGLTNGSVYYAIVNSANPGLLQLADSATDANDGIALPLFSGGASSTQSFQAVTVSSGDPTFGPAAVTPAGIANTVNLGTSNSINSGDALVYNANGAAAIGGLEDGQVYYAIVNPASPGLVMLAATPSDVLQGNAIALTSGGNAAQTFTPLTLAPGVSFGPSSVITAANINSIVTATPVGFTNGQTVVYDNGGGSDIGSLNNGQVYYAVVNSNQPYQLQLAATLGGTPITLTSTGSSSSQQFTAVSIPTPSATSAAAVVHAAGDVRVRADSEESVVSVSVAGAAAGTAAVGATIGSYTLDLTTLAYIGLEAIVFAHGNVQVAANDTDNVNMLAGTVTGAGAVAVGASISVPIVIKTTDSYISQDAVVDGLGNGDVLDANTGTFSETYAPESFNPATGLTPDDSDDEIDLGYAPGFSTGDEVVYDDGGGADIGGLTNGHIYYVILDPNNPDKLKLATTRPNALLGTAIALTSTGGHSKQSFRKVTPNTHTFNASSGILTGNAVNTIYVGTTNPFTNGEAVVYHAGGGASISGLVDGTIYYVITNSSQPNQIQLAATPGGSAISLGSVGSSSAQSLTPTIVFGTSAVDTTNNAIQVGSTNLFTQGEAVVYSAGGGTETAGLIDGGTYYVIINSSLSNEIQLATSAYNAAAGVAIALPSGGSSSTQSLTALTPTFSETFGPSAVIPNSLANTIDLGYAHGFLTGQALVYNDKGSGTDIGGLTNGQVYYAIADPTQPDRIALAATLNDALAGNAIALTPGSGQQQFDVVAAAPQTFDPAATSDSAANTIDLGYDHGFSTGQAVDYSDGSTATPIGGLTSGSTYFAIVDPSQPTKLRLAATKADALAGNALLLSLSGTTGTQHSINPAGFSLPSINNPSATAPGLYSRRLVSADTTAMQGVAVTATSSDDVEEMAISGSGAGVAAIPISASIHVLNDHTDAYIDSGAKVNTDQADAGGNQSVLVAAGSDYYHLGVAGAAGAAGVAAIGAGVDVAVVTLHTLAYINGGATVDAQNNVAVLAHSTERVLSVGVGFTVAGLVAVGGSVSVPVVNTTTLAFIGNQDPTQSSATVVHAGNNVQVAANDETHALTVDGGVGIGVGAVGVGISVPVVVFTKDTEAYISNGSDVRGLANGTDVMPVMDGTVPAIPQTFDGSSTSVVDTNDKSINLDYDPGFGTGDAVIYDNGGGTSIGGLTSGATYYVIVDSSDPEKIKLAATKADALSGNAITLTGTGSGKNQTIKSAGDFRTKNAQGVAVQATSSEDVLTVAVAGGGGKFFGLAGSVAVTVIHATTHAFIGDAVINDPTGVNAGTAQAVSVGAADFSRIHTVVPSLAGGLVGLSGAINVGAVNNDTRAYIGSGATVHALGDVDVFALSNKDFDSTTISISGGAAAFGGAVAVFTLDTALNSSQQQALQDPNNSSSNAGSSISNLQQVSDATNDLGVTQGSPGSSTQISTSGSQQTTGNSGLVTANLANTQSTAGATTTQSNMAGDTLNGSTAPETGTVAFIGGDVTAGGNISVQAKETVTATVRVGQGSGGIAGVGAAVGVLTINSNTEAFLGSGAVVAATGTLSVNSVFNDKTDCKVYAAQGGLVGLGAEVAINNDNSNQLAFVADGAKINQASALNISAQANRTVESDAGGVTGGLAAVGGAASLASAGGATVAAVGRGAQIGQTAGEAVGSMTISASNQSSVTTTGLIVSAGLFAAGADGIEGTVDPDVLAYIGQDAQVTVAGAVDVSATSTPSVSVTNQGGGGGGLSISALVTSATIGGKTWAFIDQGANISAGLISVTATTPSRNATATGYVVNIGLAGANGSNTTSEVGGSVEAFVGQTNYSFDATSAVDGTSHYITLGSSNLETGDAVVYNNGGGASIGVRNSDDTTSTLQNGGTYYVIVNPNNPDQVQLADSQTDAQKGTALALLPVSGASSIQSLTPTALSVPTTLASAGNVTINAQSVSNPTANVTLGSGGAIAISAAVSDTKSDGTTSAYVGDNTNIGTASQAVNNLTVTATSTDVATDTATLGSGGLGSGNGSDTEAHVTPTITTFLGQNVSANVSGNVNVVATSVTAEGHATANSYGGGGVNVGAPTTTVVTAPTVLSSIGAGSTLTVGGDLNVQALAHDQASPNASLTDYVQGVNLDNTSDTINFPDYGLQNGAFVVYQPASPKDAIQTPTGYLQQYQTNPDGSFVTDSSGNKIERTYHVLQVVNADGSIDPNNLRLGDAFNGGQVDAGNLFQTASGVDPTQNVIRFSSPDGFETGDAVHYLPEIGSTSIGGPDQTTTYYVRAIDPYTLKLYTSRAEAIAKPATFTSSAIDSTNHTITLSGFSDGEQVSYQAPAPVPFNNSSLNVQPVYTNGNLTGLQADPGSNDIFVGSNAFQTGDEVIYRTSDPKNPIGGLTDDTPYYVIAGSSPTNTIQLSKTQNGTAITLSAGDSSAGNYLVRPAITGLTSGDSYTLKLVPNTTDTYQLVDSKGNVVNIDSTGMSGTHKLFQDGIALQAGSGTQELHLVLTAAANPSGTDKLLGPGDVSLRLASTPSGGNGQSAASSTADGGGLGQFAFPESTLTTTPTVKAWAAPALATVGGNVTIASESLANTLATAYSAGGGAIAVVNATATTNFGTRGSNGVAAVNQAFVGTEDNSGDVSANGVQIHAAGNFTLSAKTNLVTNPSATVTGGGLGAGLNATDGANVNSSTTTTVGSGAYVSGNSLTILADVQNLGISAPSNASSYGLVVIPKATSYSNVASTAQVLIGGGATRLTGQGGVDIEARHDSFIPSLSAYAAWNGIETKTSYGETTSYNDSLHSHIVAGAGATVSAGPPAGSTTALTVAADRGAIISNATTDPTIQWDANVIVSAGASPYLLVNTVNGVATIAKAVNVTVDDSAGGGSSTLTSGPIKSNTIVVNTVNNPGSQVVFSASGGVSNSANNPYPLFTFTDTLQAVTIINNSAKPLQIGSINVANQGGASEPQVLLDSTTQKNFEFDIKHAVAPTLIDIEQNSPTSAEDINLTGDIENPIGTTLIDDKNGNISNTVGSAQIIRSNTLNLQASGSIGSSTNLVNAELIQSTDTSTNPNGLRTPQLIAEATNGDVDLDLRARNRTTSPSSLTVYAPTVSAGGNINLTLQSSVVDTGTGGATGAVHVVDQSAPALTGDYAAHFHNPAQKSNTTLDQGVYASTTNNTTTASTYNFTGATGLSAKDNISVQAANFASTDPIINIVGDTNLQPNKTTPNHIDVTTNGTINLTQVGGPMRIGTIQSTSTDVTLSVPETAQQFGLETTNTSKIAAGGNVLLQVGGNVDLVAGSSITAQGGNSTTPQGTVTIDGDYDNGATINPDPGTTFNLFGNIYGVSTTVSGNDANDVFNIGNVTAGTPMTVTGSGSNDTYNVGSNAPNSGGIVDNIQGALTIVGDGTATLNVDDTGSTAAKTGSLTSTTLTGLNMGSSGIVYSGLANLNINLGSGGNTFTILNTAAATNTALNSGTGADTIDVQSTAGTTTVNTGGGSNANTVNIGSKAPGTGGIVDNIRGALTVTGNGSDTMNVDDTGSTAAKTGTLTPTTLTGLNMGSSGITYSGLANLNIKLGSGGNTFRINDIDPATHTSVDGGTSNNDTVNATFAADFNGRLDLTSFEHGTVVVNGNFNGTLNDTLPGHLEQVTVGGSITSTGKLLAGSIDTMSVDSNLAGTVTVQQTLGTLTVGQDVSGSVSETGTITQLSIGGSITSTGVIKAVNPADPAQPTSPQGLLGNINTMTVGGGVAGLVQVSGDLTTLTVGPANTATSGDVNDVSGKIVVGGQLTTASIAGNVSGLVQETLTVNNLDIGGSLTASGVIRAVNTANASLGNINTMTVGQSLAGTVQVSGTLQNLNLVNGSMTPTGVIQAGNLNTMTIGPAHLSVGQDMAGQILVSGTLGSLRVAGGTPGSIVAGHIGTVEAYGGFGPVVLQITENGVQRRVEEAIPSNPYPLPNPYTQAATSPYATVTSAGTLEYINIQYIYESGALANPQLTARITNNVSTAADQYDLSLVTYSDTAKFNLARLDAVGVSGVRNVAVEGDLLTSVSTTAANFFSLPGGGIDTTPAGVRLPLDNLAGVAVRDYAPPTIIQAASVQAVAFGSTSDAKGNLVTGPNAKATDAEDLLAPGTVIVQANDTFRVPFADALPVAFFMDTKANNHHFDTHDVLFTDQAPNDPRGAVTALISVSVPVNSGGQPGASTIQTIALRGDGGAIQTKQPIAQAITSTGPLGDLILTAAGGLAANVTAPSIIGNIEVQGPIAGTIQTTGLRTDPITSVTAAANDDFGRLLTDAAGNVIGTTVVDAQGGGITGRLISRGNFFSQIEADGGISGLVAVQGNLGAQSGGVRYGGILTNGPISGQVVVLGNVLGDLVAHGGLKGGRIAVKGSILGNTVLDGGIDANSVLVAGGSIGNAATGTGLTAGEVQGILAANLGINLVGQTNTAGAAFFKANLNSVDPTSAAALDAIFINNGQPLEFDLYSLDLLGLDLILEHLAALHVGANGELTDSNP